MNFLRGSNALGISSEKPSTVYNSCSTYYYRKGNNLHVTFLQLLPPTATVCSNVGATTLCAPTYTSHGVSIASGRSGELLAALLKRCEQGRWVVSYRGHHLKVHEQGLFSFISFCSVFLCPTVHCHPAFPSVARWQAGPPTVGAKHLVYDPGGRAEWQINFLGLQLELELSTNKG